MTSKGLQGSMTITVYDDGSPKVCACVHVCLCVLNILATSKGKCGCLPTCAASFLESCFYVRIFSKYSSFSMVIPMTFFFFLPLFGGQEGIMGSQNLQFGDVSVPL